MLYGSVTSRGHRDLARSGVRVGNELRDRLGRDRWVDHHDDRGTNNARDWGDVADEELVLECRVDRVEASDHEQRIAVRGRAYDGFGADVAAAARPVLDHEWL